MTTLTNAIIFIVFFLSLCIVSPQVQSEGNDMDASIVLYKYNNRLLKDSKWGSIIEFQRALSLALLACDKDDIGTADGLFGKGTQKGLMRLLSCPKFNSFNVAKDHPLYGSVHSLLWQSLLPHNELPTVHQRAFALSLTHEATDYDQVEWNYGTSDDGSALTWGPYGATVGWGNEVRSILEKINKANPGMLEELFESEFSTIEQLLQENAKQGYRLLKEVHADPQRRQLFKQSLQTLGGMPEGRETYDWYALESGVWITPNLRRFYSLIPNEKTMATEIDYAFFLDIAMHASVSKKRINKAKAALKNKQESLSRALTSAERRQVIGQVWANEVSSRWRKDRIGRNVVFYIEGIGKDKLSAEELSSWQKRTGLKAINFGLSDNRRYYPDFL